MYNVVFCYRLKEDATQSDENAGETEVSAVAKSDVAECCRRRGKYGRRISFVDI